MYLIFSLFSTKVLHLSHNPSSHVPCSAISSTVPTVNNIFEQHRTLMQQFASAANLSGATEEADNSGGSGASTCGGGATPAAPGAAGGGTGAAATVQKNLFNRSVLNDVNRSIMGMGADGACQSCAHLQQQLTASQAAVASQEKMNMRLKEIFKERISSFREGVYLVTGYKVPGVWWCSLCLLSFAVDVFLCVLLLFRQIDLFNAEASDPNSLPRLRLRSMYAADPSDVLLFQVRFPSLLWRCWWAILIYYPYRLRHAQFSVFVCLCLCCAALCCLVLPCAADPRRRRRAYGVGLRPGPQPAAADLPQHGKLRPCIPSQRHHGHV
jgi:hypothetical protein